jgi:hypothetical protein
LNKNVFEILEFEETPNDDLKSETLETRMSINLNSNRPTELTMNNFMKLKEPKSKPNKVGNGKKDKPSISQGTEAPFEINVVEGAHLGGRNRRGKVTIDSGAEVSIWPASHVAWENVKPTKESEKGIGFVAANGARMENYGGPQVSFKKDGKVRAMNFEVTDCKKPLASVAKIVDKGNRVVFDQDESYIYNKKTGEKIPLQRERGTFVMVVDFEVNEEAWDENGCFRRHA